MAALTTSRSLAFVEIDVIVTIYSCPLVKHYSMWPVQNLTIWLLRLDTLRNDGGCLMRGDFVIECPTAGFNPP